MFNSRILNYSRNPERRFKFELGVGYNADLALALTLAQDTVAALLFVLKSPAVNVWLTDPGGSSIGLQVPGWINQELTSIVQARSVAIRQVLAAFDAAGIELPEPTHRVLSESPPSHPAPSAAPAPVTAADPAAALNVEATAEHELARIVAEEREATRDDDLLNREGAVSE